MIDEIRPLHVLTPEPGKARSMSAMAIFHQLMGSFRVADKPTVTIDHDLLGIFPWHFRKKSAGRIKARFTAAISGPHGPSDIGSSGIFCKARRRPEEDCAAHDRREKSNLTQGLDTELKEPAICLLLWTSRILRTLCSKVLKSSSRACDKCLSPSSRSSIPLLELSSFAFSKWLLASV
jgi:hypothetical protein